MTHNTTATTQEQADGPEGQTTLPAHRHIQRNRRTQMATTIKRRTKYDIIPAIQRARQRRHLVLIVGQDEGGCRWYAVRSHSRPDIAHLVKVEGGKVQFCSCEQHERANICPHHAAVALKLGTVPERWLLTTKGGAK